MGNFFNPDGTVWSFLSKVADLMWLNFLYVICCLPVFTIGAATSALYYVALRMVRREEGYIARDFFHSFKANFKQGTIIWLILFALGVILGMDLLILIRGDFQYAHIAVAVVMIPVFILLFVLVYVFAVLSRFDNTVINTIKNALYISLAHLPKTILMVIITYVPVLIFMSNLYLLPAIFLCAYSVSAYINALLMNKIFKKYEPKPEPVVVNDEGIFKNSQEMEGKLGK